LFHMGTLKLRLERIQSAIGILSGFNCC